MDEQDRQDRQDQSQEQSTSSPLSLPQVLLVTSPNRECGIREYGRELIEATGGQAEITEFPEPHPSRLFDRLCCGEHCNWDVIHINHHAALHAAWGSSHLLALKELGFGVVVTQHDTFEEWSIMQERHYPDLREADCLVVHEPVRGLQQHIAASFLARGGATVGYLPQPVPAHYPTQPAPLRPAGAGHHRDTLGLFGFDFPWKGFDVAVQAAKIAHWEVMLISPNITIERAEALSQLYPNGLQLIPYFAPAAEAVSLLSQCAATAFPYATGNSGTSGAVRLGLAARRPIILSPPSVCRQFRDFGVDPLAAKAVCWGEPTVEVIASHLRALANPGCWAERQAKVSVLADRWSWENAVRKTYGPVYTLLQKLSRDRRAIRKGGRG